MGPPAIEKVGSLPGQTIDSDQAVSLGSFYLGHRPLAARFGTFRYLGRLRMHQDASLNRPTDLDINREETLTVAAMLAFAGGYIDAYSWITHRVFANAQTANMLFMWIHAMAGAWAYVTVQVPALTLGIPVTGLLIALLRCEQRESAVST
jgi:hypothetical protein